MESRLGQSSLAQSGFSIHNVTGCGREHGFQLVIDSHQMMSLLPRERLTKGFKVFVTMPGDEINFYFRKLYFQARK